MSSMSLLKDFKRHIDELVHRLKRVFISWFIFLILLMSFPASVFNMESFLEGSYIPLSVYIVNIMASYVLNSPLTSSVHLIFIAKDLSMGFELWFLSAFILSFLISIPHLLLEIWKFIEPGLYERERAFLRRTFLPLIGCFIGGCVFGFTLLVPIILRAFVTVMMWFNVQPIVTYMDFVSFIATTTIFSGLFMTTPLIVYVLVRVGLIPIEPLVKYRFPLYIGMYIIAAIITPDGGSFGSAILALPVILFFEIIIQLLKRRIKRTSCCRG